MRLLRWLACLCLPALGFLLLSAGSAAASETPSAQGPVPQVQVPSVPVVLSIGDAAHFSYLTQAVSNAAAGSMPVALIDGGSDLADISADELGGVAALVLYGPVQGAASAVVLENFVRAGGLLFVDAGDAPSLTTYLARSAPALLPVTGAYVSAIQGQWGFSAVKSPLMRDLDPKKWSPPVYPIGQPWGIQQPTGTSNTGSVILSAHGVPLLVSERYGAGRVIWSGVNLPYHIDSYSNRTEARFLLDLLDASGRPAARGGVVLFQAVGPYRLTGRLEGVVSGLIVTGIHGTIAEPDDSWSASIAGLTVDCQPIGTSACYLPLPPGATGGFAINYQHSGLATPVDGAIDFLALVVAVALPFLLSKPDVRRRLTSFLNRSGWWQRRGAEEAARAEVLSGLRSPEVEVRLAALEMVSWYSISPPWDEVLADLAKRESSELVKDQLASFVALRQWEPVVSDEMRWLRSWAAAQKQQRKSPHLVATATSGDAW